MPREQPLWCQNHAQGLQVSGCLGFQVREFTNAWRDENILFFVPRCCIEPLEGAWSCIDATSTYLGDSVSWCEFRYAHRTCIIMFIHFHHLPMHSSMLWTQIQEIHRNASESWWRRPNDSSFPELPACSSVVRIYGRTSLTDTNGGSIAKVSVDFGNRSQRAMTYNFSAQASGKKKNKSCHLKFQLQQKSLLHPNYIGYWLVKEGSYNVLVFYNCYSNNLLYTSRETARFLLHHVTNRQPSGVRNRT